MDKINLPPHVLHEIASTALTKAKVNVFLSKRELASSLKITTKTVERIGFNFIHSNGQNIYNIKDVLAILEKNYTGTSKSLSSSTTFPHIIHLLQDYTQILIKKIMTNNPQINLKKPVRWIMQCDLVMLGISSRILYKLRKTGKLNYSKLNNQLYYRIDDIIDCFKDMKNDKINDLVKSSLFYQHLGE